MSTEHKVRRMRARNEASVREKADREKVEQTAQLAEQLAYREIRDAAGRVIRRLPVQRSW